MQKLDNTIYTAGEAATHARRAAKRLEAQGSWHLEHAHEQLRQAELAIARAKRQVERALEAKARWMRGEFKDHETACAAVIREEREARTAKLNSLNRRAAS